MEHPALVYRHMDELLAYAVPFLREGLEQSQPAFVAVGPGELAELRSEVGEDGVGWADTNHWFPGPARRLRAFHLFVADQMRGGATRIRLIGEPSGRKAPPSSRVSGLGTNRP